MLLFRHARGRIPLPFLWHDDFRPGGVFAILLGRQGVRSPFCHVYHLHRPAHGRTFLVSLHAYEKHYDLQ